jgi:hypothetical protein
VTARPRLSPPLGSLLPIRPAPRPGRPDPAPGQPPPGR